MGSLTELLSLQHPRPGDAVRRVGALAAVWLATGLPACNDQVVDPINIVNPTLAQLQIRRQQVLDGVVIVEGSVLDSAHPLLMTSGWS